jgi:hypothetical protein
VTPHTTPHPNPDSVAFDRLLEKWRALIGTIPCCVDCVCPWCCGPRGPGFLLCHDCAHVFPAAPGMLQGRVVPLTSALEESPWHAQLVSYRTSRSPWPLLGGLVVRFATVHAGRLCALLGGSPTATTVVPSKRGRPMPEQPLFRMISAAIQGEPTSLPQPQALLEYDAASPSRHAYAPSAFRVPSGQCVAGSRIVLVKDCWVSGATCLSAAGALLDAGAAQVVVLPIARVVRRSVRGDEHRYLEAMREPYDVSRWPHGD